MPLSWNQMLTALEYYREYERYVSTICPFHEDTRPSLLVFRDGWYRCMTCEAEGPWKQLWNKLQGAGPRRAPITRRTGWDRPDLPHAHDLKTLEEIAWSAHQVLCDNDHLKWYLEERGLDGRIEPCILGWYDGWYTVPIFKEDRSFTGLVLRAGPPIQEASGMRFIQPTGSKPQLYVPDWPLVRKRKTLFIVFGLFDALALADMRYPVCTTTGGMKSFDVKWTQGIAAKRIVIPDEWREEKTALKIRGCRVETLNYPKGIKDPADFLWQGKRKELHHQLARLV